MNIYIFTIRDKKTGNLLHSEGVPDSHNISEFELKSDYLTDKDLDTVDFYKSNGKYCYDEEIRHLLSYDFEKVIFTLEEYVFDSDSTLKRK